MFQYAVKLERIIDADTVVLIVDLGFRTYRTEAFRLQGVDTPERSTPQGKAAAGFASEWFARQTRLVLESLKPPSQEKYGRWLAQLTGYDAENVRSVLNDELLIAGHAKAYDGGAKS